MPPGAPYRGNAGKHAVGVVLRREVGDARRSRLGGATLFDRRACVGEDVHGAGLFQLRGELFEKPRVEPVVAVGRHDVFAGGAGGAVVARLGAASTLRRGHRPEARVAPRHVLADAERIVGRLFDVAYRLEVAERLRRDGFEHLGEPGRGAVAGDDD